MLPDTAASKVTAAHLSRRALLYVRQSSLKQVIHNTESAIRQYDLRGKAIALGWAADQVTVIDIDQGQSGASAANRQGFQQLVAEVSLGRAGIVLGLECSRLARNNADWHQLLEICAMTGTLICDEDGLYDPTPGTLGVSACSGCCGLRVLCLSWCLFSVVALAVSGHGCCPRVAAGLARGSTVRVPRRAGRFLLPDGFRQRLAGAGGEYGDLGFPGDGCLGRGGVREFRACFLGASGVALPSGDVEGVQGGAGGGVPGGGDRFQ